MLAIARWFTRRGGWNGAPLPVEAMVLRTVGFAYLALFVVKSFGTSPHPGLHGRGLPILAASLVLLGSLAFLLVDVRASPPNPARAAARRIAALVLITGASALLAADQPHGIWAAGPYLVAIFAGIRLGRVSGVLTLTFSLAVLAVVSALEVPGGAPVGTLVGVVPWFLVLRMIRELGAQHRALEASQAAQAQDAAAAERGRLAREMHDVLAHSLSALALKLESMRLLARERGVDAELAGALDQAHDLAASGLQDARRAIAAARGEELPGPERIGVLAEAFHEQSGLPVAVDIRGEPRELAPDARLAVYRTVQEALTNVRRHAAAERVAIRLDYGPQSTVLVVEDEAKPGTPAPLDPALVGNGYGLTGMRERAELLGGELRAEPTAAGFRVELRLPVAAGGPR